MRAKDFAPPAVSLRFLQVWRRNFLVWRKLAIPSMLGNLADPMFYLLALGYGLGALIGRIDGLPYVTFLAAGTVCYSTMNTATFEALYSAFSRMHVQRTWDAIMNAPLNLDDIVLAEAVWAASKSFLSGLAILLVVWILGLSHSPLTLWIIPLAFLIGLTFASLGLIMNALSPSYDFFLYYFTLFITPMVLLCGVFFPVDKLPPVLQSVSAVLPLSHAVDLVRPLIRGSSPDGVAIHVLVLLGYAAAGFYAALVLSRRRLLK
ncbi:MAG TPA: ABC transporter permease [Burkholderiales bacterium]|jgi:lipooligosaccharide transport system permease protein|nr:ABC transporter permease [Burkholderiales bacterium]